jgi:Flp pilus assembly protein TadG
MTTIARNRHKRTGERGASTIEFAFASLLFFLVTFGTIEFGWAVYNYNALAMAVRDGARWASVRGTTSGHPATDADIQNRVVSESLIPLSTSNVTVSPAASSRKPGASVTVAIAWTYAGLVPNLMPFTTIAMHSQTSMVILR